MVDGRARCLSDSGRVLWEFQAGGEVRSLAHTTLAGAPAVLVGSADEHLYAITGDKAKLLWKHKCHFSEERYQQAPWWTLSGKAEVVAIFPCDLDGDASPEIVCGTGAGFVETLSALGERKWLCEFFWGIPDLFNRAPMPDGSTHVLVDATASACGSWTWRLNADGKILNKNAFDTGRGSWDATKVRCNRVVDVDGQGRRLAVVGRGGAFNELAAYDAVTGELQWVHTLADRANDVIAVDLDDDGVQEIVAASKSAWLTAFDAAGNVRWATLLPNEVLAIAAGGGALFAQCGDAAVYRMNLAGEIKGVREPERQGGSSHRWRFQQGSGFLFIGNRSGEAAPLAISN
jgi:outer membrane protein assembly factor BamB